MKRYLALLLLAACNVNAPVTVNTQAPSATPAPSGSSQVAASPAPIPAPTSTPVPHVHLTYWSLTVAADPLSLSTAIPLTGFCTVYDGVTYCWDDGVKSQTHYYGLQHSTFLYTFWGMAPQGQTWDLCHGNCAIDLMAAPQAMTNLALYVIYAQATPAVVMQTGTAHDVDCVVGDTLNCGDFVLDLNGRVL